LNVATGGVGTWPLTPSALRTRLKNAPPMMS
jgi:hypothetical protein